MLLRLIGRFFTHTCPTRRNAARKIQRCFRNWQAWKRAAQRKDELRNKGTTAEDKLSWLWLLGFNCAGVVGGVAASGALYYYLISPAPPEGTGLGLDDIQNWTLFWLQLGYSALCACGLYAASPKRLSLLRMYSFTMLMFCAALLAAVSLRCHWYRHVAVL